MQSLRAQDDLGLLVAAVRRRLKQLAFKRLSPFGVTPQQLGVLWQLRSGEGLCVHEIATRLYMDDPNASRLVAKLVDRGLVDALDYPGDKRRFRLQLTPRGQRLCSEMAGTVMELQAGVSRGFDASEKETLCGLLNRIWDNLAALEEAAPAQHGAHAVGRGEPGGREAVAPASRHRGGATR